MLLGNHELEAVEGLTRFVAQLELEDLGEAVGAGPEQSARQLAGTREWVRLFGRSGEEVRLHS